MSGASVVAGAEILPAVADAGSAAAVLLQNETGIAVVDEVSALFNEWLPTFEVKAFATLVVAVAFSLLAGTIWRLGGRLKRYYPGDDVEAVQSAVFTVFAVAAATVVVFVWNVDTEVVDAFGKLAFGAPQAVIALVGVLALVVAYTITRISKGFIEESGDGTVMDAHRREALHHALQLFVYAGAFVFILALAGANPRDLLVGAGAAGLVVGLAARQTLGAVFAGFVILSARPFEVGDWVVIGDHDGLVRDISLFNTELRTWDGEYVVIPNDEVSSASIVNRSREGRLRVNLDVGVDYDTDVQAAAELAREAMEGLDEVMSAPKPQVVLKSFGDSAIVLECRFWIENPSAQRKWAAQTAVIEAVKDAFDDEGVSIPFPQRTLSERGEGLRLAQGEQVAVGDEGESAADGPEATADGGASADDAEGDGSPGDR